MPAKPRIRVWVSGFTLRQATASALSSLLPTLSVCRSSCWMELFLMSSEPIIRAATAPPIEPAMKTAAPVSASTLVLTKVRGI